MSDDLARFTAEEDQALMSVRAYARRVAVYREELMRQGVVIEEAFVLARDFAGALAASLLISPPESDDD